MCTVLLSGFSTKLTKYEVIARISLSVGALQQGESGSNNDGNKGMGEIIIYKFDDAITVDMCV